MLTCFPDLMDNPSVLDDPDGGQILYWRCCGRSWYLTTATLDEHERSARAWHLAAEAVEIARG